MTDLPSDIEKQIEELARRAREASHELSALSSRDKEAWLERCAEQLATDRKSILAANRLDLESAREKGLSEPMVKRLDLADKWNDMLAGLRDVASLPDPIGEIAGMRVRPSGVRVGRMRIPLGVIGIIYESRPNVTVDAAALCVKAGNAVILRGGSEAFHTNTALADSLRAAAQDTAVPATAVQLVPTTDRAAVDAMLKQDAYIDLLIPRGGPELIRKVSAESSIPVVKHDAGICHIYLDESADPEMAKAVVCDSKIRQMAVCNSVETLLVHPEAARTMLAEVLKALHEQGVEIRGDERTREVFAEAAPATEEDWGAEYLGPVLAVRVVDGLDAAIEHIRRYGSNHTEIILTRDYNNAQQFLRRLDSCVVGVNCSTAFADGYRLGLGAEIGISTSRLHWYGPMGLEGLTTQKFVLYGDGQLRE
jgi:glutamate-5-semialdehyde dehydrogenase